MQFETDEIHWGLDEGAAHVGGHGLSEPVRRMRCASEKK